MSIRFIEANVFRESVSNFYESVRLVYAVGVEDTRTTRVAK